MKKIKDRATADEFLKEASVMATLSHSNLVKLIGVIRHMPSAMNAMASPCAALNSPAVVSSISLVGKSETVKLSFSY